MLPSYAQLKPVISLMGVPRVPFCLFDLCVNCGSGGTIIINYTTTNEAPPPPPLSPPSPPSPLPPPPPPSPTSPAGSDQNATQQASPIDPNEELSLFLIGAIGGWILACVLLARLAYVLPCCHQVRACRPLCPCRPNMHLTRDMRHLKVAAASPSSPRTPSYL